MPNPFATRFIRPGAIPFIFPIGASADLLVERLRAANWSGQIVGDHGSGKSTLLAALTPVLEAAGRHVVTIALHQGECSLPAIDVQRLTPSTQLIIDGYEQLSWWSRRKITSLCRRLRAGLLITAHRDLGLTTIYKITPSEELTRAVVGSLMSQDAPVLLPDDVTTAYKLAGGNVRETLFKLYDVYQERNRVRLEA